MSIQEYVAQEVIRHMKYKDEEIRVLKLELENFDVILCDFCQKYRKYDWECDFCEKVSCTECEIVKNYPSWNLSGCNACDDCTTKYCTSCRNTKDICAQNEYSICK